MKRKLACFALLAGLLVGTGCVTTASPELLVQTPIASGKSYSRVTPEQVTDNNGHQVAQALEDEINREQQQNMLNPQR